MIKPNDAVKRETMYISAFSIMLSIFMQAVFILLGKWDYTVILGNIFSLAVAVLNFYFMGLCVQKAVSMEITDAKKIIKSSQLMRNIFMFTILAIGVITPFFNTISVIVPVFFPRIAVSFRPFINFRKEVIDK